MIDNRSAYNSNVYDANIINTLPYYREYHNQIMDFLSSGRFLGYQSLNYQGTNSPPMMSFTSGSDSIE